ncbi:MAG: septum formation family protein [Nocardioidaceae bacterium]
MTLAASVALVVTGCTSGGGTPRSQPSVSASASASAGTPAPALPVVPPAPEEKACYRLSLAQLTRPTNDSRPVPCGSHHDAQTIYVGTLDTVVGGHPGPVDSDHVQKQRASTCPAELADYLGGTRTDRRLSRFGVVWFSPTIQQADKGANWFRCDAIAFARGSSLYGLPVPHRLHGALDADHALDRYGLCGTAQPGAASFERVICALRHSWRAISTIHLAGGEKYPGVGAVRDAGDSTCKDQVRARNPSSLKYSYGWEWPTRKQWQAGQHYGFCWAPD